MLRKPEPAVLFLNLLVDLRRDLDWIRGRLQQLTLCVDFPTQLLVGLIVLASGYRVIIDEFVKFSLIYRKVTLVYQNVRVFCLGSSLLCKSLLHSQVMGVLLQSRIKVLIIATEALRRNIGWVKLSHLLIVKFKPVILAQICAWLLPLSLLDERIIVTTFRCALVHHYPCQLVLGVLLALDSVVNGLLL